MGRLIHCVCFLGCVLILAVFRGTDDKTMIKDVINTKIKCRTNFNILALCTHGHGTDDIFEADEVFWADRVDFLLFLERNKNT